MDALDINVHGKFLTETHNNAVNEVKDYPVSITEVITRADNYMRSVSSATIRPVDSIFAVDDVEREAKPCFDFANGKCTRVNCRFAHIATNKKKSTASTSVKCEFCGKDGHEIDKCSKYLKAKKDAAKDSAKKVQFDSGKKADAKKSDSKHADVIDVIVQGYDIDVTADREVLFGSNVETVEERQIFMINGRVSQGGSSPVTANIVRSNSFKISDPEQDMYIWHDSCANVGVFRNKHLLDNIRKGQPKNVAGFCSQGSISHIGTNSTFGTHYYESNSDFNILPHWLLAERFDCHENATATAYSFQIPGESQRRQFHKCNGRFRCYIGDIYGIPELADDTIDDTKF